jgi:RecB family exonuclease
VWWAAAPPADDDREPGIGEGNRSGASPADEAAGSVSTDRGGTFLSGQPVVVSASQVESLFECPRRWFLTSRAGGDRPAPVRTRIGSAVHAVVQNPAASLAEMTQGLAATWSGLEFPAVWMRQTEWDAAVAALTRYDAWRQATGRTVLGCEVPVDVVIDSAGPLRITGRIDRVEQDSAGKLWIIDYKTGRDLPTVPQAEANVQVGLYQVVAQAGGLATVVGPEPVIGGAELIYLRHPERAGSNLPKVFVQPAIDQCSHLDPDLRLPVSDWSVVAAVGDQWRYPTWVHHRIALAGAILTQTHYPAIAGGLCRWCSFADGCPAMAARQVTP